MSWKITVGMHGVGLPLMSTVFVMGMDVKEREGEDDKGQKGH